jgi:hypothetical protein
MVNLSKTTTLTWEGVQVNQITASVFGFLCLWSAQNVYSSIRAYFQNRKLIYLLNALQTSFFVIKTISATTYASYFNLSCAARGPLVNIPLVIAWDLIFGIILLKLLIFTPYPMFAQVFFALSGITHFLIVVIGVAFRESKIVKGICKDNYHSVYKYQYVVEVSL